MRDVMMRMARVRHVFRPLSMCMFIDRVGVLADVSRRVHPEFREAVA